MSALESIVALTPEQIAEMPYEQARDTLTEIVEALDDASLPLTTLMSLWKVGELVAAACTAHLEAAATALDDGLPTG
jgi:exodeoxyribonuclease VII small subunit